MNVHLNEISGLWQAIMSMYMSRRSWTREREQHIKHLFAANFDRWGMRLPETDPTVKEEFDELLGKLLKWVPVHITLGKFIDFAFTVEALHRGAQDDLDSHAKRMDNRILRSSTRLSRGAADEVSAWYKGRIITTDQALRIQGVELPERLEVAGRPYVRAVNGYVREDLASSKDVARGLYMLSIPSNCTFRVNCTEFAHILKERDGNSAAHPELRLAVEMMLAQIQQQIPEMTREWFYSVKN